MNKTVSIHLAGVFFHIDETAYEKLHQYLESIKSRFGNVQERNEIMNDIEARIAELFSDKLDKNRQVINLNDVEEVISVMGEPKDYTDSEAFEDDEAAYSKQDTNKRLYRDPDLKILGGVSGGLSHYFNVDVVWIRIIWVLLVLAGFGSGIILYIVLWAIVPEAKTTSEKLSMKGFKANISNIQKNVKKNFDEAAERIKNTDFNETGKRVADAAKSGASGLASVLQTLLSVVAKFAGVLLVIISLSTLVALTVMFFTGLFMNFSNNIWSEIVSQVFDTAWPVWTVVTALFLLIGVPFFYLFQAGLSLVSGGVRTAGKLVNFVLLSLMLASLAYLIAFGVMEGSKRVDTVYMEIPERQNLTVSDSLEVRVRHNENEEHTFFDSDLVYDPAKGVYEIQDEVQVRLLPTLDSLPFYEVVKKGYTIGNDGQKIDYQTVQQGHQLTIDSHFKSLIQKVNAREEVEVLLYMPENTKVKLPIGLRNLYRQRSGDLPYLDFEKYDHYIYHNQEEWLCDDCQP